MLQLTHLRDAFRRQLPILQSCIHKGPRLHSSRDEHNSELSIFTSILLAMRNISENQLRVAVDRAGYTSDVFDRIYATLAAESETTPALETSHVSHYLGALLIIGAMGWFVTNAWDRLS